MTVPRYPGGTLRLRPKDQPPAPEAGPVVPAPPDPAEVAARKVANLQREREAQEAAVIRRREQTREVLALLAARWPAAFGTPVPLALGIEREIKQGLGEERIPAMGLGRALHYWTQGPRYLAALAAGCRRVHLDGTDAGEVEEGHRDHAREVAARYAARRREVQARSGIKPDGGAADAPGQSHPPMG